MLNRGMRRLVFLSSGAIESAVVYRVDGERSLAVTTADEGLPVGVYSMRDLTGAAGESVEGQARLYLDYRLTRIDGAIDVSGDLVRFPAGLTEAGVEEFLACYAALRFGISLPKVPASVCSFSKGSTKDDLFSFVVKLSVRKRAAFKAELVGRGVDPAGDVVVVEQA